jgi:hypothetical protein
MQKYIVGALMIAAGLVFIATAAQTKTFIYPQKGQSPEQQEQDEFSCNKWAKEQTGIDPNAQVQSGAAPPPPHGRGPRREREREQQQAQQQAAAQQQQQKQQTFDRAYRTCLEGRGYKVG